MVIARLGLWARAGASAAAQNVGILRRLLQYVRPYSPRFVLMLGCTVLASATKVGGIVLIKPFGDLILGTFDMERYAKVPGLGSGVGRDLLERFAATLARSPYDALTLLILALLGLIVVQTFSQFAAVYLQTHIGGRVGVDIKLQMVGRLLTQPVAYYQHMGKGLVHQIVDQDSNAAFRTLYLVFNRMLRAPIEAAAVLGIALSIDWQLTLFASALLPAVAVTISAFRKRLQQFDSRLFHLMGAGSGILQELLATPEVVKAYQMEHFFETRYERVSRKLFRVSMSLRKSREWMGPILDLTAGGATALFVFLNGRALIRGDIDLSSFVLLYVCLIALIDPIRKMGKGYGDLFMNLMSLRRVFNMLEQTPEVHDRPDAVRLDTVEGRVEYRGVTFGYDPDRPVLHDVSLSIAPGERVALVGPSGAGKTTLARLLLRFYDPQEGAVALDGIDVRDLAQDSLRRHVGLVTQDTVLFTGTVRENIAAGRPDPGGLQTARAAHAARAHDFIMALPDGYDTVLGDHGTSLSGGQAQRIAIARALFRDTRVLVLDEATSSLDAQTEDEIHATLLELTAGRTSIIIAHRLSTILAADRVVLVLDGKIIGEGRHELMMMNHATYRDLVTRQLVPLRDDVSDMLTPGAIQ